jgi:hypothetical protein
MSKAERLPRWAFRRLNDEQKEAHNQLLWYRPGPAKRARLKQVLGWRRTRDETRALAVELLEQGLIEKAVDLRLEVSDRYLHRLLAVQEPARENRGRKPSNHAEEVALTRETDPSVPPR